MEPPHDPDTTKWGAAAVIAAAAIKAVYHFFQAEKSPKVSWRQKLEDDIKVLKEQGPPEYSDFHHRIGALEKKTNHIESVQDRRHKEIMQQLDRLLRASDLE